VHHYLSTFQRGIQVFRLLHLQLSRKISGSKNARIVEQMQRAMNLYVSHSSARRRVKKLPTADVHISFPGFITPLQALQIKDLSNFCNRFILPCEHIFTRATLHFIRQSSLHLLMKNALAHTKFLPPFFRSHSGLEKIF
jgi:hypothetical protein